MNQDVPLFQKVYDFYKLYYDIVDHFPRKSRVVLAIKIEETILGLLTAISRANFTSAQAKHTLLIEASSHVDLLKVLFRLAFELRVVDQKKYLLVEQKLDEMGRMLGGWLKTTHRP